MNRLDHLFLLSEVDRCRPLHSSSSNHPTDNGKDNTKDNIKDNTPFKTNDGTSYSPTIATSTSDDISNKKSFNNDTNTQDDKKHTKTQKNTNIIKNNKSSSFKRKSLLFDQENSDDIFCSVDAWIAQWQMLAVYHPVLIKVFNVTSIVEIINIM